MHAKKGLCLWFCCFFKEIIFVHQMYKNVVDVQSGEVFFLFSVCCDGLCFFPQPGSILADTSFKDRMKLDEIDTSEQTVNSKCEGKKEEGLLGKI